MDYNAPKEKRIVLIYWKMEKTVEVFSNLKNFCLSYPRYNYNTLNNYLSKEKIAFENEDVRVERKSIISKPKPIAPTGTARSIAAVSRKGFMRDADDDKRDLEYCLSQPVQKRAKATTFLISQ